MIEDPPLLTIKSRELNVEDSDVQALAGIPTSFVVDAMGGRGALPHNIEPLSPHVLPAGFCGRALTIDPGAADVLAVVAALDEIEAGDVLVIATAGHTGCAAIGDRVIGMAKNAGAIAIVTDGLVRDIDGIEKVGLPVYCTGVSPNSPYNTGPGSIGTSIVIGDRQITRDDVLVADRDGVVVVPGLLLKDTIKRCLHITKVENELDAEVEQGLCVPASMQELLAAGEKVRRI